MTPLVRCYKFAQKRTNDMSAYELTGRWTNLPQKHPATLLIRPQHQQGGRMSLQ
jgi:hypothetical protein